MSWTTGHDPDSASSILCGRFVKRPPRQRKAAVFVVDLTVEII
jgi:hypothetical protein